MQIKELDRDTYLRCEKDLNLHPLQSYAWGEVKWPNWDPIRIGLYDGNKLASALTILTKKIPFSSKHFGYIPRGIALSDPALLSQVIYELKSFSEVSRFTHLMVDPDLDFALFKQKAREHSEQIKSTFFQLGFKVEKKQLQPNRTTVFDLSKGEEELLATMRSKHRQYIHKAERDGVRIREGSEADLPLFGNIIDYLRTKKGYVLRGLDYYVKLWKLFTEENNARLFIAEKGKKLAGAYIILLNKENAYEMYGGTNDLGNVSRAAYLLKWECVRYCKSIGKLFYDQWGAEEWFPGLVQFKEGFGGMTIDYPPQYVYVLSPTSFALYKLFEKVNVLRQKIF